MPRLPFLFFVLAAMLVPNAAWGGTDTVVIENVSTYFATSSGMLEVKATLRNASGKDLPALAFGLEVIAGTRRDASFPPLARLTLKKGATVENTIDYYVPESFQGRRLELAAVVLSLAGDTLGRLAVAPLDVPESLVTPRALSCSTKNLGFECVVGKGDYTLRYALYRTAPGGETVEFGTETAAGGKTFSIPKAKLPPGEYVLSARVISSYRSIDAALERLVVPGVYGAVRNLIAERRGNTIHVQAEAEARGTNGALSMVFQTLSRGVACGESVRTDVIEGRAQAEVSWSGCEAPVSVGAELYAGEEKLASGFIPVTVPRIRFSFIVIAVLVIAATAAVILRRRFGALSS